MNLVYHRAQDHQWLYLLELITIPHRYAAPTAIDAPTYEEKEASRQALLLPSVV